MRFPPVVPDDAQGGPYCACLLYTSDLLMQMEDEMLSEINEVLASLLPEDGGDVSSLRISTELFQCLKDNADLCTVTLGDFGDKSFAMRMLNMGWEKCFDAYSCLLYTSSASFSSCGVPP